MQYRQLGSTGVSISEIGFGCGNTAGLMIWGSRAAQISIAERALEKGVNYFDTASSYGGGKSEENLGQVLPHLSARPLIGTKVALETAELANIPGAVRKSIERSLRRLGVDYVDMVHLHNRLCLQRGPTSRAAHGPMLRVDEMLGPGGMQQAFADLQREGKVRFFGFCAFGGEVPAVNRVIDEGRFHSMLAPYNLLNPSAGRPAPAGFSDVDYGNVITRAAGRGIGVVALRVVAAGALSGENKPHELNRGGPSESSEWGENASRARSLDEFRLSPEETLAQVAIRFALTNEQISTVLVGFSEMRHLDEAVACSGRPVFARKELEKLEALYETDFGIKAA